MRGISKAAQQELEKIRKAQGGLIRPVDVVRFASKSTTALHKYFEWDDTEAANRYRLDQASRILRVVVITDGKTNQKIRAFVSLRMDQNARQGYRAMVDVMDDKALMEELVEDARNDLAIFSKKYEKLREIAEFGGLFSEIGRIIKRVRGKPDERISA